MELISERVAKMLEGIMGACFHGNRIMDRIKAVLGVKFVMPETSLWIHYNISHKYPILADEVGDYMENRNHTEGYPETPADYTDYNTSRECFEKMLDYFKQMEELISNGIDVAKAENDKTTQKFLDNFLREQIAYTNVGLTLVDLSEQYGCEPKDNMQLDAHIHRKLKGMKP